MTPLSTSYLIANALSIKLYIKHDEFFPLANGGTKARKLKYIFNENSNLNNYNAVVTAGSNTSNHLFSTAILAAKLGLKLICIVHDKEPKIFDGIIKIVKLSGAEIRFVKMKDVKLAMDHAIEDLKKEGYKPKYIWGGGHCVEGAYALYQAVFELEEQLNGVAPDFIVVASGTGGTQAGLEVGVKKIFPKCKVLGVSVAREKVRGSNEVLKSIKELNEYLGNEIETKHEIYFDDNWIGESYAATYPELIDTIKWAAKTEGLLLDPIYTGKAFTALLSYVKKGVIPKGSNVVFWHTGGLINLFGSRVI